MDRQFETQPHNTGRSYPSRGSHERRGDALRRIRERTPEKGRTMDHGTGRRMEPERNEMIFNSFTSTYHGQAAVERRDPPSETSKDLNYSRRVNFSKQLEVHEKQTKQLPPTPSIPILRTGSITRSAPPKTRIGRTSNYSARDPTPRSSEKYSRPLGNRKTISDILAEQTDRYSQTASGIGSSDPPLGSSNRQFLTPGIGKSPRNLFSKIESLSRSKTKTSEDQRFAAEEKRKAKEPEEQTMSQTTSILTALAQKEWDMSALLPEFSGNKKSNTATNAEEKTSNAPHTESQRDTMTPSSNLNLFGYRSAHWDTPDILPEAWRELLPSKSPKGLDGGHDAHLMPKARKEATVRRKIFPHVASQTEKLDLEIRKGEASQRSPVSQQYSKAENKSVESRDKDLPKFIELQEDLGENLGTELVLVPRSGTEYSQSSEGGSRAKKRKGFGNLIRRSIASPEKEEQDLPVVAMSFEDSTDLNKGTDDTSDTDSGYDKTKWDKFEEASIDGDDDDDYLIPLSSSTRGKKWGKAFLFVTLLFVCLIFGLSLFFFFTRSTGSSAPTKLEEFTKCVSGGPNNEVLSSRYAEIRKVISATTIGDASSLDEPESAQRRALCWISNFDDYRIEVDSSTILPLLQRYTLAVLYYSWVRNGIEGPQSLVNSNFLSDVHECDWDGVLCGTEKVVTSLLLSDQLLTGPVPSELGNLKSLSFLDLRLNQLTGTVPSSIGELSRLDYFAIAFNALSGSIPSEMGLMTKLEFVNMRSSQLRGTIPAEVGQLTSLQTLLLEGNFLTGTIPKQLGNLIKSEQMSFRKNYLTGEISTEICELRDLNLSELKVDSWIECDCCTD